MHRGIMEMLFVGGNHLPRLRKAELVSYRQWPITLECWPCFTYFYPHRNIDASPSDAVIDFKPLYSL